MSLISILASNKYQSLEVGFGDLPLLQILDNRGEGLTDCDFRHDYGSLPEEFKFLW
jgi:hypothetical protein